jgi:hypothetical protein
MKIWNPLASYKTKVAGNTKDANSSTPANGAEQEPANAAPDAAPVLDSARTDSADEPKVETEAPANEAAAPTTDAPAAQAAIARVNTPVASQMVSISVADFNALQKDAKDWNDKKAEYKVLNDWYENTKASGAIPQRDTADAVAGEEVKVSKATQNAINAKKKSQKK